MLTENANARRSERAGSRSGSLASHLAKAPTDPDVRNSRIRLFDEQVC
jgi:hypothetical protein